MGYGDELMCTGHARVMQQTDPRKVKLEYGKHIWNEVFDNNPRLARIGEQGDFQIYRARENGLRPYCTGKNETRWTWTDYRPQAGEIYFHRHEAQFANLHNPHVVIEPYCKRKASPNKDWGMGRWQELVRRMTVAGIECHQLGPRGTPVVHGAKLIETETFRHACAVLSKARACVLPEGGLHHAAAAVGTPAIVIYGGFISPRQTGYDSQVSLFTGGEPCGMRMRCGHCDEAMAKIPPGLVFERLQDMLQNRAAA